MMREILFRGKRIDNGEWLYGDLYHRNEEALIRNYHEGYCVAIDPSTIGQYTGLTANGKKIFEGDIIEIRGYVYYCCWDEGNLEFMLINEKESFGMGYAASPRMNVIGNVHDNSKRWRADNFIESVADIG